MLGAADTAAAVVLAGEQRRGEEAVEARNALTEATAPKPLGSETVTAGVPGEETPGDVPGNEAESFRSPSGLPVPGETPSWS